MIARRLALIVLFALLLAGLWVYASGSVSRSAPRWLGHWLEQGFSEYGVERVEVSKVSLDWGGATVAQIVVDANLDGQALRVTGRELALVYHWRQVLGGRARSLHVGELLVEFGALLRAPVPATATAAPRQYPVSQWLPWGWRSQLPLESVVIKSWRGVGTFEPIGRWTAAGSLSLADELKLPLSLGWPQGQLTGELLASAADPLALEVSAADAEGRGIGDLVLTLKPSQSGWYWRGSGQLELSRLWAQVNQSAYRGQSGNWPVEAQLGGSAGFDFQLDHPELLSGPWPQRWWAQPGYGLRASLESRFEHAGFAPFAPAGRGQVEVLVALDNERETVTLGPLSLEGTVATAEVGVDDESAQWLGWGEELSYTAAAGGGALSLARLNERWYLELQEAGVGVGNDHSRLDARSLTVTTELGAEGDPEAGWMGSDLSLRLRGEALPQLQLTSAARLRGEVQEVDLRLRDELDALALSVDADLATDEVHGDYEWELRSPDMAALSGHWLPLLKTLGGLDESVVLEAGQMRAQSRFSGDLRAGMGLSQRVQVQAQGVSGTYAEEFRFEGLAVTAQLLGEGGWRTLGPVEMTAERLNVGFEVSRLHARIQVPRPTELGAPRIEIPSLSAQVFGGELFAPQPQAWDFGAKQNRLMLRAKDLRLTDLVSLQTGQDIRAHGLLDGALPLTISHGRVVIEGGYLRAQPPGGSIAYHADASARALAEGSSELSMAMALLEDFQFDTLDSAVVYDEHGKLRLGLALAGRNPQKFNGRGVNFNINLEQNLEPLLQSLRLGDQLAEDIGRRSQ